MSLIGQLRTQVKYGPYKGLWTTDEKAKLADQLFFALNRPEIREQKTMLSYYNFQVNQVKHYKNFYSCMH